MLTFKNNDKIDDLLENSYREMSLIDLRKHLKVVLREIARNPTELNRKKYSIIREIMFEKYHKI